MVAMNFERIRGNLLERRRNLSDWLRRATPEKRQIRLGPADEQAVEAHLDMLDTAADKAASNTLGICTVCHGYVEDELLEMDYTACVCISHLSEEEIRRLESELELSQVVQRALLPHQVPTIPGLDLAAYSRPAEIVGGDYFDFLRFRDGAHGLAIADVAGKGVSAGLLVASVQTVLRTHVTERDSPADVLTYLNRFFAHNIHFTTFVTLFLGHFDQRTRTLTYANAGHNPPLLFRNGGGHADGVQQLPPTGAAIGLIEECDFTTGVVTLQPGDLLLLYTDGVIDAQNSEGERFGMERIIELAKGARRLGAKEVVREFRHTLDEFTGGRTPADDTTIVVGKITE